MRSARIGFLLVNNNIPYFSAVNCDDFCTLATLCAGVCVGIQHMAAKLKQEMALSLDERISNISVTNAVCWTEMKYFFNLHTKKIA